MEAFNKILKAHFTNYEEQPLLLFIRILVEYVIPFYSNNTREFLFYRIPSKKVVKMANQLDTTKFEMKESYGLECLYKGRHHTHTINFNTKSCTCRWFLAFAVCSHIIGACDQYNRELQGYKATRAFVYKAKRGRKPKPMTFTEQAFRQNPMPLIPLVVDEDSRESLFIPGNALPLPVMSAQPTVEPLPELGAVVEPPTVRITRAYNKRKIDVTTDVSSSSVPVPEKRRRGRPRKVAGALAD